MDLINQPGNPFFSSLKTPLSKAHSRATTGKINKNKVNNKSLGLENKLKYKFQLVNRNDSHDQFG